MKSVIACFVASVVTASAFAASSSTQHPPFDSRANENHLSLRANVIEAEMGNARKGGAMTPATVQANLARLARVREEAAVYQRKQGFVSAAERASYDRELDAIEKTVPENFRQPMPPGQ